MEGSWGYGLIWLTCEWAHMATLAGLANTGLQYGPKEVSGNVLVRFVNPKMAIKRMLMGKLQYLRMIISIINIMRFSTTH